MLLNEKLEELLHNNGIVSYVYSTQSNTICSLFLLFAKAVYMLNSFLIFSS